MNSETIFYLLLFVTAFGFLFEQWLEYLNLRHERPELPAAVAVFYDLEKYNRSQSYHRALTRFGFWSDSFSFLLSVSFLLLGGFGWLDSWLRQFISGEIPLALAYFGLLLLASDVLTLPFQWYATFKIEADYGFNKTTPRIFFTDKLKGYVLGGFIGGGLLTLLIHLVNLIGPNFWIWFGLLASVFMLLVNMFYASLVLPLFNKLTPLPPGELKSAIETFAQKVGFPLDSIFVMDGSKRSSKANAFFSGIGKKKKIVLYDTLIEKHTTEELVSVLAHEVGHYKKKHIVWSYILSIAQLFFLLFVLSWVIGNQNLSSALGASQNGIHLNLIAFAILFSPISSMTGLIMGSLSRKNEFEADAYARETSDGEALSTALKRLSVDSLSDLYPHPWYVFFHYSHPPLLERLRALKS